MECPKCQKKTMRGAKFCIACGASLSGAPKETTTAAAAAPPPPPPKKDDDSNGKPKRSLYEEIL